jgi:DNA-directed RNA polymerase sigma subunit (sigma70/sigma32)
MLYGDNVACSLEDVAQEIGCTRQNASLIEHRALKKLRRAFAKRGVTCYADLFRGAEQV